MTKRIEVIPAKPEARQEKKEQKQLNDALREARRTGAAIVVPVKYGPAS